MQKHEQEIKTNQTNRDEEFIMKPYVDWCFKELMRNPRTREGFISALLNIPPEEIGKTILLENEMSKRSEEEKLGVLDVRILLESGTQIDMEMQVVYMEHWDKRSMFYLCKMYAGQMKRRENYNALQKCVQVGVLNFKYFKDDEECYRIVNLRDNKTGKIYNDQLEIQVLELPKIPEEYQHPDGVIAWMKFFRGGNKEELGMIAKENEYLEEAYEDLLEMSQDEEKRFFYEARERDLRDRRYIEEQAEKVFQKWEQAEKERQQTQKEMEAAKQKLEEYNREIEKSKREIEESRREIEESRREIEESRREAEESKQEAEEARRVHRAFILEFYRKNRMTLEEAAEEYGVSVEEFQKLV